MFVYLVLHLKYYKLLTIGHVTLKHPFEGRLLCVLAFVNINLKAKFEAPPIPKEYDTGLQKLKLGYVTTTTPIQRLRFILTISGAV